MEDEIKKMQLITKGKVDKSSTKRGAGRKVVRRGEQEERRKCEVEKNEGMIKKKRNMKEKDTNKGRN